MAADGTRTRYSLFQHGRDGRVTFMLMMFATLRKGTAHPGYIRDSVRFFVGAGDQQGVPPFACPSAKAQLRKMLRWYSLFHTTM